MKILLFTTHLNIGGISVYTVNTAKYLKKENMDVAVASSGGNMEKILEENAIPHIKLDIKTKAEFGPKLLKTLPRLIELIEKEKFDIIHAQTRVTQVASQLVSVFTKVPFVSTCHGFFNNKRLSRKLFPCWGQKVIAISKSVNRHLIDDFRLKEDRVEVIYNGIETEKYNENIFEKDYELKNKMGIGKDVLVIGTVGRLSSVKGFRYLIDAFSALTKKYPNTHLLIVGEGKEKGFLTKKIKSYGLSEKVTVETNNMPVEKYMSIIDIFSFPSLSEGLGLSLMEAMASGKPCVASDIGGISELIIDREDGILVPPQDSVRLREAISLLIGDKALREKVGNNARAKAGKNFSIVDTVRKTIKVYEEAVKG